MVVTIIAFIVIFSVLVLAHEWGHFYAARKSGIHVEEFGIGLPPMAKKIYVDKKGTAYTLNWIPFGGFVRLFGEDSHDPKVLHDKKSFASKSIGKRTWVILAGVLMNLVLAWALVTFGFIVGTKPFLANGQDIQKAVAEGVVETQKVFFVHAIDEGTPLSETDVKKGDSIFAVNGIPVSETTDLKSVILPNSEVRLSFHHEGKELEAVAQANDNGKLGMTISLQDFVLKVKDVQYPFYIAPFKAVKEVGRLSVLTVEMLGSMVRTLVTTFAVPAGVAGPVGIAKMTHTFAQQGLMALIQFTALLSISLAVINVMPFPALDGGRFLFIVFELILRRRLNARLESIAHTFGFALLMLLILVVTWNDIMNLIR